MNSMSSTLPDRKRLPAHNYKAETVDKVEKVFKDHVHLIPLGQRIKMWQFVNYILERGLEKFQEEIKQTGQWPEM